MVRRESPTPSKRAVLHVPTIIYSALLGSLGTAVSAALSILGFVIDGRLQDILLFPGQDFLCCMYAAARENPVHSDLYVNHVVIFQAAFGGLLAAVTAFLFRRKALRRWLLALTFSIFLVSVLFHPVIFDSLDRWRLYSISPTLRHLAVVRSTGDMEKEAVGRGLVDEALVVRLAAITKLVASKEFDTAEKRRLLEMQMHSEDSIVRETANTWRSFIVD